MGIEISNITKNYGKNRALDNVSLTLENNKIYGLLGRNGAGKTTLLNIVTNRIFADSGTITIDGEPAAENDSALGKIYLMSEKTYYPEKMRICDVFKWTAEFYPAFDAGYAAAAAEKFELNLRQYVKSLSTGFTSIFKLIIALSVNTPYVFLDEPVLGLDANNRDLFYRLLLERYGENPCTFVISTHLIEEAANVIENVIIIKKGKIIRSEPCEALLSGGYTITGPAATVDEYIRERSIIGTDSIGGLKTAYIIGRPENIPDGTEISGLNLQKMFIQLTNS